jgi:hypothetical protein
VPDLGPWDVPKPRWVQRDDRWYPGRLEMWRPAVTHLPGGGEGLAGLVRYHVGAGLQHYEWVPAGRLRDAGPDPNAGDEAEPEQPW